ncbi:MAG TPA: hypothetical protein PKD54_05560, partial [Pirellulaceae bacterium]|nr:hypothetical protein [Pirellulaceae bacterium]
HQIIQPLGLPSGWYLKPEYDAHLLRLTVAAVIPEPSMAVILWFGSLALLGRRRTLVNSARSR